MEPEGELDDSTFEEALEMNRKLKAMLAQAQCPEARVPRRSASHGPQLPRRDSGPSTARTSRSDFRGCRREGYPPRMGATSDYCQDKVAPRHATDNSHKINRRRDQERIAQENQGIANRLVAAQQDSHGKMRPRGQDRSLPPGWTRGVGGRML